MQQSKKRCPQCKKYKDLDQFHECKSNFDGLQGRCKPCHIEKVKKSKAIREALKNNRPDQAKAIA